MLSYIDLSFYCLQLNTDWSVPIKLLQTIRPQGD